MNKEFDPEELQEHIENHLYNNDFNSYSAFEVNIYEDENIKHGTIKVAVSILDMCGVREHMILNELMEELGYELQDEVVFQDTYNTFDSYDSSTTVECYSSKHLYIRS